MQRFARLSPRSFDPSDVEEFLDQSVLFKKNREFFDVLRVAKSFEVFLPYPAMKALSECVRTVTEIRLNPRHSPHKQKYSFVGL